PLIVSKELGKYTVVANVGYRKNFSDSDRDSVFTSAAVGHATGPHSRAMIEVASELTGGTSRRTDVRIGWIKVMFPDRSKRYQTSLFTSVGRSIGLTEDGMTHVTALFGISIQGKRNE
ncbi:MAG: hypothetical protein ABIO95_06720, partial [Bdellovibrionota bacterium]